MKKLFGLFLAFALLFAPLAGLALAQDVTEDTTVATDGGTTTTDGGTTATDGGTTTIMDDEGGAE